MVYVADNDTKAYGDEERTKQLTQSELYDAYVKGCLIVDEDGIMYNPISYAVTSETGVGTLTYAVPTTTTVELVESTTLVVATAVSKADT